MRIVYSTVLILAASLGLAVAQPCFTNFTMTGGPAQFNIFGEVGTTNQILTCTNLGSSNWTILTSIVVTNCPYSIADTPGQPKGARFYRVIDPNWPRNTPTNMALIPAGSFMMGDTFNEGQYYELPVHPVYTSAFFMDKYEVTFGLWNTVMAWSLTNGYNYDYPGIGKDTNNPVLAVDWFDMVKWCNARSQMEGKLPSYYLDAAMTQIYSNGQAAPFVNWNAGYRLPTESEWEKAARGGASGHRFPWSDTDTISQSRANYYGDTNDYKYDTSAAQGFDPVFDFGEQPYTAPVGSFPPNAYGLYDMAGNAWEWCWDYADSYQSQFQTDPRGPSTGSLRVGRGGNWNYYAVDCRNSYRYGNSPGYSASNIGFRTVLPVP